MAAERNEHLNRVFIIGAARETDHFHIIVIHLSRNAACHKGSTLHSVDDQHLVPYSFSAVFSKISFP